MRTLMMVAASAALLAGCSGGNKSASNGSVQVGNATVKTEGANTIVTTPQGTAQVTAGSSAGATLPGGLPAYPGAQTAGGVAVTDTANGMQGQVVTFSTSDDAGKVLDFYANAAQQAGMQTLARASAGGTNTLALQKGNETVTVSATSVGGTTQVQVAGGTR